MVGPKAVQTAAQKARSRESRKGLPWDPTTVAQKDLQKAVQMVHKMAEQRAAQMACRWVPRMAVQMVDRWEYL